MNKKSTVSDEDKKLFLDNWDKTTPPLKDDSDVHQPSRKRLKPTTNNIAQYTEIAGGFYRAGLQKKQVEKLIRGKLKIEAELELHGLYVNDARQQVEAFLRDCATKDYRCVKIIHGKGLHSADNRPVIKHELKQWLQQNAMVLAYCPALGKDGGAGASYLYLKR